MKPAIYDLRKLMLIPDVMERGFALMSWEKRWLVDVEALESTPQELLREIDRESHRHTVRHGLTLKLADFIAKESGFVTWGESSSWPDMEHSTAAVTVLRREPR